MRTPNKIKYLATWTDGELEDLQDRHGMFRASEPELADGLFAALVQLYRSLRDHHIEETTELWARIEDLKGQLESSGTVEAPRIRPDDLGLIVAALEAYYDGDDKRDRARALARRLEGPG